MEMKRRKNLMKEYRHIRGYSSDITNNFVYERMMN